MNHPTEEQKAALAKLREPFPDHQISQLPKPLKKREEMDKLPKATCKVCGGYHATSNMMHLSYVGHAALTDRLLDSDPLWSWEPLSFDAQGLPVLDRDGGMWIKLTVAGMTRMGYGDAQGKSGGDAMKERIGDALRNAAMRFGAALDLWHKGDLHLDEPEAQQQTPAPQKAAPKEKPQLSEAQAKYFPRVKAALDALHGSDVAAKKATIKANTALPAKGTYPARDGIEDYRTLDGDRLKYFCNAVEKLAERNATMCNECRQVGTHSDSCPNATPPQ